MSTGEIRITEHVVITHQMETFVNGQSKGTIQCNGEPSLLEVAQALAREHGVTSFNVVIDGKSATTEAQVDAPASSAKSIGITAKDSVATEPTAEETPASTEAELEPEEEEEEEEEESDTQPTTEDAA